MTLEQNKAFMHRYLESSTREDTEGYRNLMAEDFIAHIAGGPVNRDVFIQHNNTFNLAFSDRQFVIEDLTAEGDMVTARVTWHGTHTGPFLGMPPTGSRVVISAFIMERVRDGKAVEHWSLFDQLSMMQQLGFIPPPKPKG